MGLVPRAQGRKASNPPDMRRKGKQRGLGETSVRDQNGSDPLKIERTLNFQLQEINPYPNYLPQPEPAALNGAETVHFTEPTCHQI